MIYKVNDTKYISYLDSSSMAAQWPKDEVVSDFNYFAYLRFINKQDLESQQRLMRLPIIQHRPRSEKVEVKMKDEVVRTNPTIMCQEEDCKRCERECGGYRFHYVGAWTCKNAVGVTPAQGRYTWSRCSDCLMCSCR